MSGAVEAPVFRPGSGGSLFCGDTLNVPLRSDSVDLIATSPPFWRSRQYEDNGEAFEGQLGQETTPEQYLENLWAVTSELFRTLKPSGSLFFEVGDRYGTGPVSDWTEPLVGLPWKFAFGCINRGWKLRAEILWTRSDAMRESTVDKVTRKHTTIFHFTKTDEYFSDLAALGEPAKTSVWDIPVESFDVPDELPGHEAYWPSELVRRFVIGWTPQPTYDHTPIVFDPFVGSGTTVGVSKELGRHGIGLDMSYSYLQLAAWRTWHSNQFSHIA